MPGSILRTSILLRPREDLVSLELPPELGHPIRYFQTSLRIVELSARFHFDLVEEAGGPELTKLHRILFPTHQHLLLLGFPLVRHRLLR